MSQGGESLAFPLTSFVHSAIQTLAKHLPRQHTSEATPACGSTESTQCFPNPPGNLARDLPQSPAGFSQNLAVHLQTPIYGLAQPRWKAPQTHDFSKKIHHEETSEGSVSLQCRDSLIREAQMTTVPPEATTLRRTLPVWWSLWGCRFQIKLKGTQYHE